MIIQMDTLGKNGRFGNQIFQFFFLQIVKKKIQCEIRFPNWIGIEFFEIEQSLPLLIPGVRAAFEILHLEGCELSDDLARIDLLLKTGFKVVDISGYFQYHTLALLPYRDLFLRSLSFRRTLVGEVQAACERVGFDIQGSMAVHFRVGDFLQYQDHPYFWFASISKLATAIKLRNPETDVPVYLASDNVIEISKELESHGIKTITTHHLFNDLNEVEALCIDFIIMSSVKKLIISNSTFSYSAAMLNNNADLFLRPESHDGEYVEFEPWNDFIMLKNINT